jgi:hypothetical protein
LKKHSGLTACENHLVKQVKAISDRYQADNWRIQAAEKTENRRSQNTRKDDEAFPSCRCKPLVSHKTFGIFHTFS